MKPLERKVYQDGNKEAWTAFAVRQFCNCTCARRYRASQEGVTRDSGRKRAQRLFKPTACQRCGITEKRLDRHHKDNDTLNNTPENVMFLCASCHAKMHWEIGSYARRVRQQRITKRDGLGRIVTSQG